METTSDRPPTARCRPAGQQAMPGRDARQAAGHHGYHRAEGATVAPAQSRGASGVSGDLTVCLVGERSEPGRSGPVLAAVWMEDGSVGLAPGGNIPPRCGLAPSSEKWRTERTQLGSVPRVRLRSSLRFAPLLHAFAELARGRRSSPTGGSRDASARPASPSRRRSATTRRSSPGGLPAWRP